MGERMKIVINRCFGGFSLPTDFIKANGIEDMFEWMDNHDMRTDLDLIEYLENGGNPNGFCSTLAIIEIPSCATDWEIIEYDGLEYIIAVVDGKIVHIKE